MPLFGIGTSALLSFQRNLATTGHNIANAATPGYSRQRVELEARNPQRLVGNYIGQGVQVNTIRRIADDFVNIQLRTSITAASNGTVRAEYAARIDRLLADSSTGLAPAMDRFFNAANDVASDPTSSSTRQVLLTESESLVERFRSLSGRIEEQRELLNSSIRVNVDEINEFATALADLNRGIVAGSGGGAVPNDLLDARDRVLNQLAEKIDVTTSTQENGALNVFIGNGQGLVLGDNANRLSAASLSGDPRNLDIGFGSGQSAMDITRFMSGGELGALLETRRVVLDTAQNGLGLLAVTLGTAFNEQHKLGLDLNGDPGTDVFRVPQPTVSSYDNKPSPGVTFIPENLSEITNKDYQLRFDGTNYSLRRMQDNATVTLNETAPGIFEADGLAIDTAGLTPAAGDRWLIQPTRLAAERLKMELTDPSAFAATSGALPDATNQGDGRIAGLRVTDAADPNFTAPMAVVSDGTDLTVLGARYGAANSGSARIEGFQVVDGQHANLRDPVAVTYDAATDRFTVGAETYPRDPSGLTRLEANGWALEIRGLPANGDTFSVSEQGTTAIADPKTTIAGDGWELDIAGAPPSGDVFSVNFSPNRQGDNRNMLALAGLAEQRLVGGSATFPDGYNNLLAEVGTRTRQAQIARDSSISLLSQAQTQREAISGVNLDEEAANLLRFQQAYQAAAQVIAISSSLFDTLLAATRR